MARGPKQVYIYIYIDIDILLSPWINLRYFPLLVPCSVKISIDLLLGITDRGNFFNESAIIFSVHSLIHKFIIINIKIILY